MYLFLFFLGKYRLTFDVVDKTFFLKFLPTILLVPFKILYNDI